MSRQQDAALNRGGNWPVYPGHNWKSSQWKAPPSGPRHLQSCAPINNADYTYREGSRSAGVASYSEYRLKHSIQSMPDHSGGWLGSDSHHLQRIHDQQDVVSKGQVQAQVYRHVEPVPQVEYAFPSVEEQQGETKEEKGAAPVRMSTDEKNKILQLMIREKDRFLQAERPDRRDFFDHIADLGRAELKFSRLTGHNVEDTIHKRLCNYRRNTTVKGDARDRQEELIDTWNNIVDPECPQKPISRVGQEAATIFRKISIGNIDRAFQVLIDPGSTPTAWQKAEIALGVQTMVSDDTFLDSRTKDKVHQWLRESKQGVLLATLQGGGLESTPDARPVERTAKEMESQSADQLAGGALEQKPKGNKKCKKRQNRDRTALEISPGKLWGSEEPREGQPPTIQPRQAKPAKTPWWSGVANSGGVGGSPAGLVIDLTESPEHVSSRKRKAATEDDPTPVPAKKRKVTRDIALEPGDVADSPGQFDTTDSAHQSGHMTSKKSATAKTQDKTHMENLQMAEVCMSLKGQDKKKRKHTSKNSVSSDRQASDTSKPTGKRTRK